MPFFWWGEQKAANSHVPVANGPFMEQIVIVEVIISNTWCVKCTRHAAPVRFMEQYWVRSNYSITKNISYLSKLNKHSHVEYLQHEPQLKKQKNTNAKLEIILEVV